MSSHPLLVFALALAVALAAGGRLLVDQQAQRQETGSVLKLLLGESRRAFAMHVFLKADAYFHQGFYPSVFDSPAAAEAKTHLVEATEENHHHEHNHGHAHNQHRDWIEAFGCHFQPSEHRHLEGLGQAREILPWLRLAAELDPQRVETYTVTAYWLREQLNQVKEAEAFLREGLRANPDSYEILFELGRLYAENDRDVPRARIVLELAVEKWLRQEASKVSPDHVSYRQILGQLAALEERAGNLERALAHYFRVYQVSPNPAMVQKRIEELRAKLAAPQKPPP